MEDSHAGKKKKSINWALIPLFHLLCVLEAQKQHPQDSVAWSFNLTRESIQQVREEFETVLKLCDGYMRKTTRLVIDFELV